MYNFIHMHNYRTVYDYIINYISLQLYSYKARETSICKTPKWSRIRRTRLTRSRRRRRTRLTRSLGKRGRRSRGRRRRRRARRRRSRGNRRPRIVPTHVVCSLWTLLLSDLISSRGWEWGSAPSCVISCCVSFRYSSLRSSRMAMLVARPVYIPSRPSLQVSRPESCSMFDCILIGSILGRCSVSRIDTTRIRTPGTTRQRLSFCAASFEYFRSIWKFQCIFVDITLRRSCRISFPIHLALASRLGCTCRMTFAHV